MSVLRDPDLVGRRVTVMDRRGRWHHGLLRMKRKQTTRNTGRTLWIGREQVWEVEGFEPLTLMGVRS